MLLRKLCQSTPEHRQILRHVREVQELGYTHIKSSLDDGDIVELQRRSDEIFGWEFSGAPFLSTDILPKSRSFHGLIQREPAYTLARQLLGPNLILLSATLHYGGPGSPNQAWHLDYRRDWPVRRPQNPMWCVFPMLIVGYYLDDLTTDLGPLWVVPASHRRERRPPQIDTHLPDEVPLLPSAGSILAFDARLWHRAGGNSTDRPRRALFFNYSLAWRLSKERFQGELIEDLLSQADEELYGLLRHS